jgi:hypothetical protein
LSHDINLPLDIRDKYIKPSGIYVKKKSKVLYERNHTFTRYQTHTGIR